MIRSARLSVRAAGWNRFPERRARIDAPDLSDRLGACFEIEVGLRSCPRKKARKSRTGDEDENEDGVRTEFSGQEHLKVTKLAA